METKEKKKPEAKKAEVKNVETKENAWEYKDRHYYLTNNQEPLTYKLASRHTQRHPLFYFDPEKGYNREIRYATNQKSPFADEQEGPVTLEHIMFNNGVLFVPKEKVQLQQLLSLYHPAKNRSYLEYDKVEEAIDELEDLELELEASTIAYQAEIDHAEAILRVEIGSKVSSMTSKEIKRDLIIFAKRNPKAFLELVNDENVTLRNFAIRATESGIVCLLYTSDAADE